MSIQFKAGVRVRDLQPQTALAISVCYSIYQDAGLDTMTVTSINDGRHNANSYHYRGRAFDLRTKGTGAGPSLASEIDRALRPLGFDVLLEDFGGPNEHIHVEFDRRGDL